MASAITHFYIKKSLITSSYLPTNLATTTFDGVEYYDLGTICSPKLYDGTASVDFTNFYKDENLSNLLKLGASSGYGNVLPSGYFKYVSGSTTTNFQPVLVGNKPQNYNFASITSSGTYSIIRGTDSSGDYLQIGSNVYRASSFSPDYVVPRYIGFVLQGGGGGGDGGYWLAPGGGGGAGGTAVGVLNLGTSFNYTITIGSGGSGGKSAGGGSGSGSQSSIGSSIYAYGGGAGGNNTGGSGASSAVSGLTVISQTHSGSNGAGSGSGGNKTAFTVKISNNSSDTNSAYYISLPGGSSSSGTSSTSGGGGASCLYKGGNGGSSGNSGGSGSYGSGGGGGGKKNFDGGSGGAGGTGCVKFYY